MQVYKILRKHKVTRHVCSQSLSSRQAKLFHTQHTHLCVLATTFKRFVQIIFPHSKILDAATIFYYHKNDFVKMTQEQFCDFGEEQLKILLDWYAVKRKCKKIDSSKSGSISSSTANKLNYETIFNIKTSGKSKPKIIAEEIEMDPPIDYEKAKCEWDLLKVKMRTCQRMKM